MAATRMTIVAVFNHRMSRPLFFLLRENFLMGSPRQEGLRRQVEGAEPKPRTTVQSH